MTDISTGLFDSFRSADPETNQILNNVLMAKCEQLMNDHGPDAFMSPRADAIFHETGHAIIAAHDKFPIERVYVQMCKVMPIYGEIWEGKTVARGSRPWQTNLTTPPDVVLKRISFTIAGLAAEQTALGGKARAGSSLDEVIAGQCMCQQLTFRDEYKHIDPVHLWNAIWFRTMAVILHNKAMAQTLTAKLDFTETIRGKALQQVLATVQQLPGDEMSVEALMKRWRKS